MWIEKFAVAPMMGVTDPFARILYRLFSKRAVLYTEMKAVQTLLHSSQEHLIEQEGSQLSPVVLQVGGSDSESLREVAKKVEDARYQAINLNIGCPSNKVQSGRWGACLMKEPELVGECVQACKDVVKIPVTVKCRIGIDNDEGSERLEKFLSIMEDAQCDSVTVHARKAILKGLSPAQNRKKPPLNYEMVYELKKKFNNMPIFINGGIESIEECLSHLNHVDGVMLGRAIDKNPFLLSQVDGKIYLEQEDQDSKSKFEDKKQIALDFIEMCLPKISSKKCEQSVVRAASSILSGLSGVSKWRAAACDIMSDNSYTDGKTSRLNLILQKLYHNVGYKGE